jgi:hypothetical protein
MNKTSNHTAKAAVLTALHQIEIYEFPIPQIKDDEILLDVEGCGICGTDVHKYKRDPFKLLPVVLGHEGTGTISALGTQVKTESAGQLLIKSSLPCLCRMIARLPRTFPHAPISATASVFTGFFPIRRTTISMGILPRTWSFAATRLFLKETA